LKFSTYLLDKVIEDKKREKENLRLRLVEAAFHALDRLSREIHFEEAYLFGSITKPYRFSTESDIDIGFVGLRDGDFFRAMAFISREIGFDVDVIQLEGHKLEQKVKKEGMKWKRKG